MHDDCTTFDEASFGRVRQDVFQTQVGEMIADDPAHACEPEVRQCSQHDTLARDRIGQDDVERGQAIGRDNQEMVVAYRVDVADLAALHERQ